MPHCTVPRLFGLKKWFDERFADLCDEHDQRYMLRDVWKWEADLALMRGMWNRKYRLLATLTFLMCQSPYGIWLWYN